MTEIGCVVSVKDDAAVVSMPMSPECRKCGVCLAAGDGRDVLVLAKNAAGAGVGDAVEIEIEAGKAVAAAFVIYMIPVFMTIAGFIVGNAITGGAEDANLPIALAVVFLVASFVGVWLYDVRLRRTQRHTAVVTRVVSEDEAEKKRRVREVTLGG